MTKFNITELGRNEEVLRKLTKKEIFIFLGHIRKSGLENVTLV